MVIPALFIAVLEADLVEWALYLLVSIPAFSIPVISHLLKSMLVVASAFINIPRLLPGECCRQYWLMRSGVGDKEASVLLIKLFLEEFPLRFSSLLVSPQDGSQS